MRNVEDIESRLSYLDGWGGFRLGLSLPANVLRVSAECAEFFEQLDDGGGGRLLQTRLVPHQLVHRVAESRSRVAHRVRTSSAPHGW